ncbi:MAG: dihydrolipoyl dehydrogenase [Chloroflexi bacterium]|jgi:dihydrolipoamide dehydrogenase|nr:dihydrolipoyl dehydrogenase [Chloroflexota bacterium]|tara:strand:+ start:3807 stop:5213 length:1407 start_codon:yes stop_codon:yes gene_type:complete
MSEKNFDVIVIGAGPGGYHAAIRASQLGLTVGLVEKDDGTGIGGLGGVCLNWGCIPSKSLLKNAELLNEMRNPEEWGFSFKEFKADISKAIDRSRAVSSKLTQGIAYLIKKNKIELFMGTAKFISSTKIEVGNEILTGGNIIIATGARPRSLPNLEIDKKLIITSREALELRAKPNSIAIIGASAIGCEFAYFFNAYGVDVSLFEIMDRLVPKEDGEISKELERQFKKQGINAFTSSNIKNVTKNKNSVTLEYDLKGESFSKEFDKVMLGVGIQPNTDELSLDNAGIQIDENGFIIVDDYMKTNVNGVFAIGDVTGKLPLAHVAFDQGILASEVIAGKEVQGISNYIDMPRCTYCSPQIASIGITEEQAIENKLNYSIGKVPFQVAGKSIAINDSNGFAKVISDSVTGEILGAHIIGAEATEMIGEIGMLKYLEGTNEELHRLTHAHPTLSEVIKEAAANTNNEAIHF